MKLVKTTLTFGQQCEINSKLRKGEMEQTKIDMELAELIYKQLEKSTRKKSYSISSAMSIVNKQEGYICFDTARRINIITTIKARPFGGYIRFDNNNGGGLNDKTETTWYKIVE